MARTKAQENRAIRQEALREQLSNQKHVEKVVENIVKIEKLDFGKKGDDGEVDYKSMQANSYKMQALKTANEQRLKLINKYLPDIKNVELANDGGGELVIKLMEYSGDE